MSIWQSALTISIMRPSCFFRHYYYNVFFALHTEMHYKEVQKNVWRTVHVGACLQKAMAGVEVESAIHLSLALRPCAALRVLFRL